MGVLQWARERLFGGGAAAPASTRASSDVQSESQWRGLVTAGPSVSGVAVTETAALGLPAVLQAIRVLTGVFALVPLHYYRETASGRERASDDPLWDLFNRQPGSQTPFGLKETMLGDLLIAGNYYAWTPRDPTSRPRSLTRLQPARCKPAEYFDELDGTTVFIDATLPNGRGGRYSTDQIWHVPGLSRDGLAGIAPLAYLRDALGGAIATGQYAQSYWAGHGKPETVLTAAGRIDAATKALIRDDWKSRFNGGPLADKVAVVDQGLTAEFHDHDHSKAQMIETRTFQVLDIARAFGVPPHLIFEMSKATFGNIEHQSLEFVTYHLGPHMERVAQAATMAFAAPGHYFEFMPDALLKGDIKARWEAYWLQRQAGAINGDEIRVRENMPPIGGAAGGEYWRPGNMTLAGSPPLGQQQPGAAPATEPEPSA